MVTIKTTEYDFSSRKVAESGILLEAKDEWMA